MVAMPRPSTALLLLFSPFVFALLSAAAAASAKYHADPKADCISLQKSLHLENTTILNTTYIAAPATITTPGVCQSTTLVTASPLCRVQFRINTTSTSSVYGEAWLPDTWYGRFLLTGNGGLGGCACSFFKLTPRRKPNFQMLLEY
jgi:hypothetical protein